MKHLKFKKETIKEYINADLKISLSRCCHYTISDETEATGHFYFVKDFAIGTLGDTYVVIKQLKSDWTERIYEFRNFNNNTVVGQLTISGFIAHKSLKILLEIIHKEHYEWEVLKANKGFFVLTGTFSYFSARLYNQKEGLLINWNYKSSQVYKYRLEQLP